MSLRGERFRLDLDAPNFQFNVENPEPVQPFRDAVKDVTERTPVAPPPPPAVTSTRTGFPEHRSRKYNTFKQRPNPVKSQSKPAQLPEVSDRAIINHIAKKNGIDLSDSAARDKVAINAENTERISAMSLDDIQEARDEIMSSFDPARLAKFRELFKKTNIDETEQQPVNSLPSLESNTGLPGEGGPAESVSLQQNEQDLEDEPLEENPTFEPGLSPSSSEAILPPSEISVHFPHPPRERSDHKPPDLNDPDYLAKLHEHYFPDLPHDPTQTSWMQDPSSEELDASTYNPSRPGFAPSAIRFSFTGALITPTEALDIPVSAGLHHHGDAPSSAGYTIPELAMLERSTLSAQRCIAYQTLGRILYRLGKGEFGAKGNELCEGLWACVERERVVEIMMHEANRGSGHISAATYATEALWLWRRGGGGERGVLRNNERRAE